MRIAVLLLALLLALSDPANAAIAFGWTNFQSNSFTSASTSVSIGTTSANTACGTRTTGDVMIAALWIENETTDTITPPAGWTQIGSNTTDGGSFASYWRHVVGSNGEACSYTFSWVNSQFMAWSLVSYSGVNNLTPVDVSLVSTCSASTTCQANSITTTVANDILITTFITGADTTLATVPSGMTSRFSINQESSTNSTNLADLPLGAAGATGNKLMSGVGASAHTWVYMMLALQPSAGGGGGGSTPSMTTLGIGAF